MLEGCTSIVCIGSQQVLCCYAYYMDVKTYTRPTYKADMIVYLFCLYSLLNIHRDLPVLLYFFGLLGHILFRRLPNVLFRCSCRDLNPDSGSANMMYQRLNDVGHLDTYCFIGYNRHAFFSSPSRFKILKPIFHRKLGLRWLQNAKKINTKDMKCTCPTPAPTPEAQRHLYSTDWRRGLASGLTQILGLAWGVWRWVTQKIGIS